MNNAIRPLLASLVLLATAATAVAQTPTWTFTPTLKRLDASDNPLTGTVNVRQRTERLRIGVYIRVSTSATGSSDPLGLEQLTGVIHFTGGGGLSSAHIGNVLDDITAGNKAAGQAGWRTRLTSGNGTFSAAGFVLLPPSNNRIAIGPISDITTLTGNRGAWCTPSSGSCEIFLGVITVPMTDMPAASGGSLSVKFAGTAINDMVSINSMRSAGTPSIQNGNTIDYSICPVAGCPVPVSFASNAYSVAEGDTGTGNTVDVTVALSQTYGSAVTVPITARTTGMGAGTAPTSAYTLPSPSSVTFAAGETRKTFTVTTVGNDADAADAAEMQTLVLDFGTLPAAVTAGGTTSTTITINDDDHPSATVAFGAASYAATEGGDAAEVAVTLTAPAAPGSLERPVSIPITTTLAGGASNADFSGVTATTTLTFPATTAGASTQTITVTATDDTDGACATCTGASDTNESITLGFGSLPEAVSAGSQSTTSVSLQDNDSDRVDLAVNVTSLGEGDGATSVMVTGTLRVNQVASLASAIEVPLGTSGTATSGAGNDYTVTSDTLTFATGATSGATVSRTLTVTPIVDSVVEAVKTIVITGTPAGILNAVTDAPAINLNDDDTATVSITAPAGSVSEGTDGIGQADTATAGFTATLSAQVATAVTVSWSATTDSSASTTDADPDADLVARSGTIVFPAGAAGTPRTINVNIENDALSEVDEVFRVALGAVTGAPARSSGGSPVNTVTVHGTNGVADATIAKNDPLAVGLAALGPLAEGRSASITLRVTGGISTNDIVASVSVALGSEGGSGAQTGAPADTGCPGSNEICWDDDGDPATARAAITGAVPVTIASGQTTVTFSRIFIADDGEGDADDVLTFTVTNALGGRDSDGNTDGIGVIAAGGGDVEPARMGQVREAFLVSIGDVMTGATRNEGGQFAVPVTVTVDETPAAALLVRYSVVGTGTNPATAADYRDPGRGAVTIAPARCSPGGCGTNIRVDVVDDELSEDAETFTVTLTELVYADGVTSDRRALGLGSPTSTDELTIGENDALTVSLSASGPETVRESSVVAFTVSLVGGLSTQAVTVTIGYDAARSMAGAAAAGAMRGADMEDFDGLGLPGEGIKVVIPAGQRSATFSLTFMREAGAEREGREFLVFGITDVKGGGRRLPPRYDPDAPSNSFGTVIVEVNLEERARAMRHTLAAFGRTVASGMVDAVEGRAAASRSLEGSRLTLAGETLSVDVFRFLGAGAGDEPAGDGAEPAGDEGAALMRSIERLLGLATDGMGGASIDPVSGRELLAGSSFQLAPGALASGAGSLSLWGRGTRTGFESREKDLSVDGDVLSGYLGMDFRVREDVLAGVALSYSEGETDYQFRGSSGTKGTIDTTLTGVHPYAHWQPRAGLSVWAMVGKGWGDATLDDGDSDPVETDLEMSMGAVGGRRTLASAGGLDWSLKADAFAVRMETEERTEDLPSVKADSHRMRVAMEGARSTELDGGRTLAGSVEFGGRLDDGDSVEGAGAEVGGGLSYADPGLGLDVEARGRLLLAHAASGFDEWGASLAATFDPGVPGRGLHLSFEPVWGNSASGVDALWEDGGPIGARGGFRDGSADPADSSPDMVMAAQAGYGLGVMDARGLLTPFGAMTFSDESSRVRLGTRLTLSVPRDLDFEFELYGEREGGTGEDASDRSVTFDSRMKRGFGEDGGAVELFSKVRTGDAKEHVVGLRTRMRF